MNNFDNFYGFFCLLGIYLKLIVILSFTLDYLISKWYGIMIVYKVGDRLTIIRVGFLIDLKGGEMDGICTGLQFFCKMTAK